VKISKKTLAAARKAANAQGVSLDTWADKVLAAAAASNQSSDVAALLREISAKIDRISSQQSLAERANEQLAATIHELGKSYAVVRRTTGQFLGDVATRTSTAIDEVRERTRDLIGQVNWPAPDAAEEPAAANEVKRAEPSAEPPPAKRRRSIRKPAAKSRRGGTRPKRSTNRGTARSRRSKPASRR
jgi:hypothetical protein